jgi:hypothetical protein
MFLGFAGPRMASAGGPAAGAWIGVALSAVTRFFTPVALLTAASGITMVFVLDEWDWTQAFVWVGLAVFVLALAVALGNNVPAMKAARSAAQAGDIQQAAANGRKVVRGGVSIVTLLIAAEIAMVLRLGAG